MKKNFLIVNDDGIYSPGLLALAEVASQFGSVRIVAPDVERSSMGHAITSSRPLAYRKTKIMDFEAFRVDGTPADCVALGMHNWETVEAVLSGINLGPNIGNACWHSGTLAGAKQGALMGSRGIAFSAPPPAEDSTFDEFKPWVAEALDLLLGYPELKLVNVNFPQNPTGVRWTHQSVRHYDGLVVPGVDPMGRSHYWFVVKPLEALEEESDRWAVQHNFVSITPLRLDLTDYKSLSEMNEIRKL